MPKVSIADYNTTVDFPDEMPQEEILAVLRKKFPAKGGEVAGVPEWGYKNPNLYGVYGAGKELAKTIPYVKYADPEERDAFMKKDTQHQTRDLLMENLGLIGGIAAGPIFKGAGPFMKGLSPKAYDALTKSKLYEALTKKRVVRPKSAEPLPASAAEPPTPKAVPEIVQPKATSQAVTPEKPPLPRGDVMPLEEQQNVIQKIIQEGIINKERPFIADETQRAMYNIADTISKYPAYGRDILTKYNITPEELSSEILKAGTMHGKGLNEFSQWAKAMKQAFPDDPAIQKTLGRIGKLESVTFWDTVKNAYRTVDDKRRMLMVTQLATAARNAISQGTRYGFGILDDGLQGVFKTAGGMPKQEAFAQFMGDWTAIMGRMTPSKRVGLENILKKYPESAAEMLSAPIHDIVLGGKISNALMYLNRTQEYFFRKMVFDSRVTAWGKKAGVVPYSADIPETVLKKAVKESMEMTFAAPQKEGFGKAVMDAYKAIPMLTTIHPYPRFWMNAVKFLWDFNPTGYISAASRARFFSKDPEAVYQAASRATIGTIMLGAGIAFRNSEYAGEKWYEIDVGDNKYIDTRAFAPFSTYLFLGEAIAHPERLSGKDWAEGALSISRIAGTGLMLVDLLRTESVDSMKKILKGFAGQYMGGFTVPFRSVKDLMEETTNLSTRESPLTGPALSNIPIVGEKMLPPLPSFTRGGTSRREQTQLRQATGLTVKTKTPLEKEIHRLNLQHIYPKTGDATFDRLISEKAGPFVNHYGTRIIQNQKYRDSDDETKKFMLRETISGVKKSIRERITMPYYEGNLTQHHTPSAKYGYLNDLVGKGRLGRIQLQALFEKQPWIFPEEKKKALLKKAVLK